MRESFEGNSQPLYVQLSEAIKRRIQDGELKAGDKLPSEAILQKVYSVSRVTVRKAIQELAKENYLISMQGKGSYVSQVSVFKRRTKLKSFTELCKQQGKSTIAVVLKADMVNGSKDQCNFFNIKTNEFVLNIERIRKVDGIPVVFEKSVYTPSCAFLQKEDLRGSVYELLQNKYWIYPTKRGLNEVDIQYSKEKEKEYLGIRQGVPVLRSRVQIYDMDGCPLHEVWQTVRIDKPELFQYYKE